MVVMANEVKTKGVSLFDKLFEKDDEVIINVRGKNKYVVIDIERYKTLIKDAEEGEIEHKLAALSGLGSFSLGGKDFSDLKSEMGNG